MFDDAIEQTRRPLDNVPRFIAFARFAHDLLGWFEAQSALGSIKLSCVALPEIEKAPMGVRIRHHFTLVAVDGIVPDANDYAVEYLPYAMMGAGVFQLSRNDQAVQRFLAMPLDNVLAYKELVYGLALRIHASFEHIYITNDVGLRSSGF